MVLKTCSVFRYKDMCICRQFKCVFYIWVLRAVNFEPSQSLGGAKTGDPREKLPDQPQAELGLSHM